MHSATVRPAIVRRVSAIARRVSVVARIAGGSIIEEKVSALARKPPYKTQ